MNNPSDDGGAAACPTTPPAAGFPIPVNEAERLAALRDLRILDTDAEERFDRIVRLAVAHFGMPVARISFVDEERTWFKARIGMSVTQAPRRISVCSHAIMDDAPLVVPDLAADPRFRDSPQVARPPHFRFYAGAPLVLAGGVRVGSLCLMDHVPHPEFGDTQTTFLADLAKIVVDELELHRQVVDHEDRLERTGRALSSAQRAKERFLAIVGHELRTPLNAILGFGQLIGDEALGSIGEPRYLEYNGHMCAAAARLDRMIDRVLMYADAQSTEIRMQEAVLAIRPLVERCAAQTAMEGQLTTDIAVEIDASAPSCLYGDEVQIAQVVSELLTNAAAFSPPSETVRLSVQRHDEGGVAIRVTDQGTGIPPDRLQSVLSGFAQGDESLSRAHEGLGLGLAIANALTELHGGRLSLTRLPEGGTMVEVTFPASRNRTMAELSDDR